MTANASPLSILGNVDAGCANRLADSPVSTRRVIRPLAILEVVRRRGRSWGLLAQYEEARLGIKR